MRSASRSPSRSCATGPWWTSSPSHPSWSPPDRRRHHGTVGHAASSHRRVLLCAPLSGRRARIIAPNEAPGPVSSTAAAALPRISTAWRRAWPAPARSATVVSGGRQGAAATGGLEDADMINDSHIDLAGFVASEPAFKRIAGGTSTAKLRVAYTERRFNRETGEWGDGPTSFVTVLCWRTLADNVAVCLRKGEPVLVRGRLRVREYEGKDGSRGTETEVDASSIVHDLSRGVAHFSRTRRAPGETAAENAEALAAQAHDGEGGAVVNGTDESGAAGSASGQNGADENGAGDGVLDERAVAEFASELTEAAGEVTA